MHSFMRQDRSVVSFYNRDDWLHILFSGVLLLHKFNIDDPLEASAVHLGGGTWGVLAVSFFNNEIGIFYSS